MRHWIGVAVLLLGHFSIAQNHSIDCKKMQCNEDFLKVYKKALKGDAKAQNKIGEMFHFGKGVQRDFHLAKKWYLQASNQGDAEAPNHIGRLYSNGEGVQKNSLEACGWYRVARDRGNEWGKVNFKKCFAATKVASEK